MSAGARRERTRIGQLLAARRKARRRGLPVSPAGSCPSGKVRWGSRKNAEVALTRALLSPNPRRAEQRVYECPTCAGWHLTSRPTWATGEPHGDGYR